jgi:hypothetical protein
MCSRTGDPHRTLRVQADQSSADSVQQPVADLDGTHTLRVPLQTTGCPVASCNAVELQKHALSSASAVEHVNNISSLPSDPV